jgi:hypothetical protein
MPDSSPDTHLPHDHHLPSSKPKATASHGKRGTSLQTHAEKPTSGERLVRMGWLLVGATFLLLCAFTAITIFVKVRGSHNEDKSDGAVAENRESAPPDESNRTPRLSEDRTTTEENHLLHVEEVHRVLGSGFSPLSHPQDSMPPQLEDPSPLPPPPQIKPKPTPPKTEPQNPPPPKVEPNKPPQTKIETDKTPQPKVVRETTNPVPPPKLSIAELDTAFEKRMHDADEGGREILLAVPELRLFSDLEIESFREQEKAAQTGIGRRVGVQSLEYAYDVQLNREMLKAGMKEGLPIRVGPASVMDGSTALLVQTLSKSLRDLGFVSVPGVVGRAGAPGVGRVIDPRTGKVISTGAGLPNGPNGIDNAASSDKTEAFKTWCDENKVEKFRGALATLLQMLQVEDVPTRLVLVRELAKVNGAGSTAALAKRALVDLSPEVRDAAVAALEKRPSNQYLPVLLQGLRYPWPPVADRAALALRKLKPEGAVPRLVDLLDQSDPSVPVLNPKTKKGSVRELVRLNHMRNCLLCHAPSANDKDGLVRGLVPTPGKPLPRLYYAGQNGNFVRADTTFLRQDFSINLPVKAAAPWPDEQRFDFVTRVRQLKPEEAEIIAAEAKSDYPQRDAVRYALRGLTGKDGGETSESWRTLLGITKDKPADIDKTTKKKSG